MATPNNMDQQHYTSTTASCSFGGEPQMPTMTMDQGLSPISAAAAGGNTTTAMTQLPPPGGGGGGVSGAANQATTTTTGGCGGSYAAASSFYPLMPTPSPADSGVMSPMTPLSGYTTGSSNSMTPEQNMSIAGGDDSPEHHSFVPPSSPFYGNGVGGGGGSTTTNNTFVTLESVRSPYSKHLSGGGGGGGGGSSSSQSSPDSPCPLMLVGMLTAAAEDVSLYTLPSLTSPGGSNNMMVGEDQSLPPIIGPPAGCCCCYQCQVQQEQSYNHQQHQWAHQHHPQQPHTNPMSLPHLQIGMVRSFATPCNKSYGISRHYLAF